MLLPLGGNYAKPVNIHKVVIHFVLLPENTFNVETKFLMQLDDGCIESQYFAIKLVQLQFIECVLQHEEFHLATRSSWS